MDIGEWIAEQEQDLLCEIEDEYRSKTGVFEMIAQQETRRVIYRCGLKGCGHTWAYDYQVNRRPYGVDRFGYPKNIINLLRRDGDTTIDQSYGHDFKCPKCHTHSRTKSNEVKGRLSDHKCDPRCTGAKGADCECSCGGANHGKDYL